MTSWMPPMAAEVGSSLKATRGSRCRRGRNADGRAIDDRIGSVCDGRTEASAASKFRVFVFWEKAAVSTVRSCPR